MKTYKHLYEEFISEENIQTAIVNASKGKRNRSMMREMYQTPEKWISIIRRWLIDYRNPQHHPVVIYDGVSRKKRTIVCPTNKEQVIHHMLCNILKPIFMHGMYEHSYGSIPKRGGLAGRNAIEKWITHDRRNCKYVLKMDIHKFFDSVPHDILKQRLQQIIKDDKFLHILFEVIDETDIGLPLGFYTSQWLSNWYLQELDHYIKEDLGAVYYIRYMDDMVIFGSNSRKLHRMRKAISNYLETNLNLSMKDNWQVYRFDYIKWKDFDINREKGTREHYGRDLDFMGFRFYSDRIILRKSIMYRLSRKAIKIFKKEQLNVYDARQILSYLGWLDYTDTYNIYLEHIKPFVCVKKCKRRIAADDKRKARERNLIDELDKKRIHSDAIRAGYNLVEDIQLCAP